MATIKEVAKMAGVSPSTVSRALSDKVFVDPSTKDRVMKAVAALNYHPNPLAKGLKDGKTEMLGVITPDISNIYFSTVVKSIEKYAARNGYTILLANYNEDIVQEKAAVQLLKKRFVDGLAIIPLCKEMDHIYSLKEEGIPFVLVNRWVNEEVNCISIDQRGGCYDVMNYIIKNGHTKISVVFRNFNQRIYLERYSGVMDALKENHLEDSERFFLYDVDSMEDADAAVTRLLTQKERPTVIFATSEIYVFSIYHAIYKLGLRIPEDISVVGFDNLPSSSYMHPPLTAYWQAIDRIAEQSVDNLLRQIRNEQTLPEKILLRGSMISRGSLSKLN